MTDQNDQFPILVIADTPDKAEFLNKQLRSQRLRVQIYWASKISGWEAVEEEPDLIFAFSETTSEPLDVLLAESNRIGAPMLMVEAGETPADDATRSRALSLGVAAWVPLNDSPLLSAVTKREKMRANLDRSLRELRDQNARYKAQIDRLATRVPDAIGYLSDGVIVYANPAMNYLLSQNTSENVIGLPFMDFLSRESQTVFKSELRKITRYSKESRSQRIKIALATEPERFYPMEISRARLEGHWELEMVVSQSDLPSGVDSGDKRKVIVPNDPKLADDGASENKSKVLSPQLFSRRVTRILGQPLSGKTPVICVLRPANEQEILSLYKHLGYAELGGLLEVYLANMLDSEDIACRIEGLEVVIFIMRKSEAVVGKFLESLLHSLSRKRFEVRSKSSYIGFCAGYTLVDQLRNVDELIERARASAQGQRGDIRSALQPASDYASQTEHEWEVVIREALDDHRFGLQLSPVQDISTGASSYISSPVVLDREARELPLASLLLAPQGTAPHNDIQRQLVGYSFFKLIQLTQIKPESRITVSLGESAIADEKLRKFLLELIEQAQDKSPIENLILELPLQQAAQRAREVEAFAAMASELHFNLGLRGVLPGDALESCLSVTHPASLRTDPSIAAEIEEEGAPGLTTIHQLLHTASKHSTTLIVSGVSRASTMASLYNLGVTTLEGPAIGNKELFMPKETLSALPTLTEQ